MLQLSKDLDLIRAVGSLRCAEGENTDVLCVRRTDRNELGTQLTHRELWRTAKTTVAEDQDFGRQRIRGRHIGRFGSGAARVGQTGGHAQGFIQLAAVLRRFDRLHSTFQQTAIVGKRLLDDRSIRKTNYHRHTARAQLLIDQLDQFRLGRFQTRRFHIGGTHAGGGVHQEDVSLANQLGTHPTGPQAGQDRQQQQQQLQKQQQVLTQFLPEAVDVQILQRAMPQVSTRDFQRLTPQLQEVQ